MCKNIVFLFILVFFFLLTRNTQAQKATFFLGGIQVNEPNQETWVNTLKTVGFNTVEVTVYAKQGDWNSDSLWWNTADTSIVFEIRAAKKAGLKVILILRVALDHSFKANKFLWHGMIFPKTEAITKQWFDKYNDFTLFWAKIAQKEKIDVFIVGSEMNALTSTVPTEKLPGLEEFYLNDTKQKEFNNQFLPFENEINEKHLWTRGSDNYESLTIFLSEKAEINKKWAKEVSFSGNIAQINAHRKILLSHWNGIINSVKKAYKGHLSYAANFDNYMLVGFWNKLDYIGINAYFPLRKPSDSLHKELAIYNSWVAILKTIEGFKFNNNIIQKPVIFTELGFTARENCTIEPWNSNGFSVEKSSDSTATPKLLIWQEQPFSFYERNLAIYSLYKAVADTKFDLQGILYWKLSTNETQKKYESFLLHISPQTKDSLQKTLLQFYDL